MTGNDLCICQHLKKNHYSSGCFLCDCRFFKQNSGYNKQITNDNGNSFGRVRSKENLNNNKKVYEYYG